MHYLACAPPLYLHRATLKGSLIYGLTLSFGIHVIPCAPWQYQTVQWNVICEKIVRSDEERDSK